MDVGGGGAPHQVVLHFTSFDHDPVDMISLQMLCGYFYFYKQAAHPQIFHRYCSNRENGAKTPAGIFDVY